jgi:hypothetical protein
MSDEDRIEYLQSQIQRNNRSLNDPYEQNKWVEREDNERLRREIERLQSNDSDY